MMLARQLAAIATVCAALTVHVASAVAALDHTPPMRWPSAVTTARSGHWLIGVARGVPLPRAVLRAGARQVLPGTLAVPIGEARTVGRLLAHHGLLRYAEADVPAVRASVPDSSPGSWARGAIVSPTLGWPSQAAEIAVIDDFVDDSLPDLAGHVRFLNATDASTVNGPHGTMVASVASAAANGSGVMGVLPGAPIASYGVPADPTCLDLARGIDAIARASIPIVNVSMGTRGDCFTLYVAVEEAFGLGTLVVASAGNEFDNGNPVIYPAAYPHVLSVGAVTPQLTPAFFSSANAAVDIAAPGVDVPMAIPPAFDTDDGTADGLTTADGTSFSAPMVAAAAAWVLSVHPTLSTGQLADTLRNSARDLRPTGWDADTGWGLVDVAAALKLHRPTDDLGEPNDEIGMVNGTLFRGADPYVWRGSGRRTLRASADAVEDPVDVYRIRIAARSSIEITLAPTFGNPDLAVLDGSARSLSDTRARVCRSRRGPRKLDGCALAWRGHRARLVYVAVSVAPSSQGLNTAYRLSFRRLPKR